MVFHIAIHSKGKKNGTYKIRYSQGKCFITNRSCITNPVITDVAYSKSFNTKYKLSLPAMAKVRPATVLHLPATRW